jgi:chlorosome envelope protein B
MSNGTNDLSGAFSGLIDTMGKLAQQQVEVVSAGINAVPKLVEPLCKAATDLVGNLFSTLNQVLQNISSAIAPKK